jgi:hypothetical protein
MSVIVDTNVAVVANRVAPQASPQCVLACVHKLGQIMNQDKIVLDSLRLILKEYAIHLRSAGQPGVGDRFYRWILLNQKNPARCEWTTITPLEDDTSNFQEFPSDPRLADFDRSDRKFVAVARAHPDQPPILQAVDSKWWRWKTALIENKVDVEFICETDIQRLS